MHAYTRITHPHLTARLARTTLPRQLMATRRDTEILRPGEYREIERQLRFFACGRPGAHGIVSRPKTQLAFDSQICYVGGIYLGQNLECQPPTHFTGWLTNDR